VSSLLMAHQHNTGHSVPENGGREIDPAILVWKTLGTPGLISSKGKVPYPSWSVEGCSS